MGNRLTEGRAGEAPTNDYSYVAGTNRLSSLSINGTTIESFTYTPNGNIVDYIGSGEPTVNVSYNKANRVGTIAKNGTQIAQYTYDGLGQRVVKTFAGTPTTGALFAYGQDGSLLEETNISGAAEADYIYLDGTPIGDLTPASKTLYYLHTDHLGTPQLATNNAKATEWQAIYEPFGWGNSVEGTITQNLRLPGQYFDSETTSYHNGFRDYVAILGRYGQSDPIGLGGGVNSYSYVDNSPYDNVDRYGLDFSIYSLAGGHYYVEFYTSSGYRRFEFAPVNSIEESAVIASLGLFPVPGTISEEPNNESFVFQVPGVYCATFTARGDKLATILELLEGQDFTYDPLMTLGIGDNCLTFALQVRQLAILINQHDNGQ